MAGRGLKKNLKMGSISSEKVVAVLLVSAYLYLGICALAQDDLLDGNSRESSATSLQITNWWEEVDGGTPAAYESLESATLVLTAPNASSLIPYTERGFDESVEVAIAWWMNPAFYNETSNYRNYLRSDTENQISDYSTDSRLFFDFITENLDSALDESALEETLILYRGISGDIVNNVLDNSEYLDDAFASTTYDVAVSLEYGRPSSDGYQNVLVLQRFEGKDALYINEHEREFLLPRGTKWDVINHVDVENLTLEADFTLYNSSSSIVQFNKVRLIYIKERED